MEWSFQFSWVRTVDADELRRVDLAAQADAEGRVEKGREQRERRRDEAEQWRAQREAGDADHSEDQTHQLGELQRATGSRSVTGPSRGATTAAKTRP